LRQNMASEQEERERLRYLQLKAKAAGAAPAVQPPAFVSAPQETTRAVSSQRETTPGMFSRAASAVGRFLSGAIEHPRQTVAGLAEGVSESMPGAQLGKRVKSIQPEDVNIGELWRIGQGGEPSVEPRLPTPLPEDVPEQRKVARGLGEFGGRVAQGIVAGAAIPGAGLGGALASSAVSNLPFLEKPIAEGDWAGAGGDMLINTAIDMALFGAGKGIKALGKGFENAGVEAIAHEMKVPDRIAKQISNKLSVAQRRVAKTISKYDLESIKGNFEKLSQKAGNLAHSKAQQADVLIAEFASKNPEKTVNAFDFYNDLKKYIASPESTIPSSEVDGAIKAIDDIFKGQAQKGLIPENATVTLPQLVEIKRDLQKGKTLFRKGIEGVSADPTKSQVYEEAYLAVVDKVRKEVPEAAALNQEARDLIWLQKSADAAASRTQKHNLIWGLAEGSGGVTSAALAIHSPQRAIPILATTSLLLGGRRVLSQGRGASALIETGKALQRTGPGIREAIGAPGGFPGVARIGQGKKANILTKLGQSGSIGGLPAKLQDMKPAIKSPVSGKIYTSDKTAFGHKQILNQISKTEPNAEKAAWKALFDDNSGVGSEYIGFIDKNGKFLSRIEAEKQIETAMSGGLTGIYHEAGGSPLGMLGLTGAGAGGVLTAGGLALEAKRRQQDKNVPTRYSLLEQQQENDRREMELLKSLSPQELSAIRKYLERR
jgi:hypothetical protein